MKQQSFSDYEYSCRKKKTKREEFLDTMEEIIPWDEWVEFVRPYYPSGKRGRPVKGIEKMLRMYLLQVLYMPQRKPQLHGKITALCRSNNRTSPHLDRTQK